MPFQPHFGPELRHRCGAVFRLDGQRMVHRRQEGRAVAPRSRLRQRHITVAHQAAHRRRRCAPGDGVVHHCRQRVHIRPWALFHAGDLGVLLHRRVAGLQDHRQRLGHVADHPPRRAEIQQQRALGAGQHHHVVGGDVAVVALGVVQHDQRLGQRMQQGAQPGLAGCAVHGAQGVLQRLALVEGHHHVGRAVVFPEAVDLHQRRMVELCQQPRFIDEALAPGFEGFAVALALDLHLRDAHPRGQHRGHVFLERHLAAQ